MDIRKEIRAILSEVFSEATPSKHFKDRVYNRLTSSVYTRPSFDYSGVEKQIETIKKINFEPEESYAIFLNKFPVTYVSKDPVSGVASVGDEVWAVVRENVITTIFFRNSHQKDVKVKDVDNVLSIKTLYKYYIDSPKNEDGTVDFSMSSIEKKPESSNKKFKLDLPVVNLDNKTWYVDVQNERLIYTKNVKKSISFNDLDEKHLEKVIDLVTL